MPRNARVDVGDEIYHVINRSNGRYQIFNTKTDYRIFEELLLETKELVDMRLLAYIVMPNHWHLVLYPKKDSDLGTFMHRLTNAHTRKVHALTNTNGNGHLYQGRYKSFIVDTDNYLLSVIKYVERNAVRAKLARQCENWQWGSAYRRINGTRGEKKLLDPSPTSLPRDYTQWINTPDNPQDIELVRASVSKGTPCGREEWVSRMVAAYQLESTLRSPGRPKKR
jgi:putative transposase